MGEAFDEWKSIGVTGLCILFKRLLICLTFRGVFLGPGF